MLVLYPVNSHQKEQVEFREYIAQLRERQYHPQSVVEFAVKLGKGKSDVLRVLEGEDLDVAISSFISKNNLKPNVSTADCVVCIQG
jgi:hypothetical protein